MENSHIAAIEQAIENAYKEQSKLTPEVLALEGMNSSRVRHLYNNLGAISTKYLEVGVWCGASLISTCFANDLEHFGIDSFTEFNPEGTVQAKFRRNCMLHLGKHNYTDQDCFQVKELHFQPDMYTYDGGHGESDHIMAVTHFFPMMADRFVFVVDDFGKEGSGFHQVQTGTRKGLEFMSKQYRVVKEWELPKSDGFWEGIGIFLIERI